MKYQNIQLFYENLINSPNKGSIINIHMIYSVLVVFAPHCRFSIWSININKILVS